MPGGTQTESFDRSTFASRPAVWTQGQVLFLNVEDGQDFIPLTTLGDGKCSHQCNLNIASIESLGLIVTTYDDLAAELAALTREQMMDITYPINRRNPFRIILAQLRNNFSIQPSLKESTRALIALIEPLLQDPPYGHKWSFPL